MERFFIRCLPIAFTFLTDVRSRLEIFLKTLRCSPGYVEYNFDNPVEFFFSISLWKRLFFEKNLIFFKIG